MQTQSHLRRYGVLGVLLLLAQTLALVTFTSPPGSAATTSGYYVGVPYTRLVDTTTGVGGSTSSFTAAQTRAYTVLGTANVPASGVAAVVLDISVKSSTSTSDTGVTIWPAGATRPSADAIRFNSTTAPMTNTVVVAPGTNGAISIYNTAGTTALNVDVQGYFTDGTGAGFVPDTETIADTTTGTGLPAAKLAAGSSKTLQVSGTENIPSTAKSVFANVTTSSASAAGALKLLPGGSTASSYPNSVEFSAPSSESTGMVLPLNSSGQLLINNPSSATVHLRLDVQGYFDGASTVAGQFTPLGQQSLYNTVGSTPLAAGASKDIAVGGTNGMPQYGIAGAVLTVEARDWTAVGSLTVKGTGTGVTIPPLLSYTAAESGGGEATTAIVYPGELGKVTVTNNGTSAVHVTVNVQGWFDAERAIPVAEEAQFIADATHYGATNDIANRAVFDRDLAGGLITSTNVGQVKDVSLPSVPPSVYSDTDPEDDAASDLPPADADGTKEVAEDTSLQWMSHPDYQTATATNGTCNSGYRLGSYNHVYRAYNAFGEYMYSLTFRKRWCYSRTNHRIGTTWSNRNSIVPVIYSYFGNTWNFGGVNSSDAHFAKRNGYARGAHEAWTKVRMNHCALKYALCTATYITMGTIGYWDGSKNAYWRKQ